jgi:hypothetical protein
MRKNNISGDAFMKQNFQTVLRSVFSLAFIVIVVGSYVIAAQTVTTGEWKASVNSKKEGKIQLSFSRASEKNNRNTMGSSYELNELQGLSENQLTAAEANVRFSLVREAGTIECEGKFTAGKGAGTYRFTPNPQFISAMKSRGFDFEKPSKRGSGSDVNDRLFTATALNVTTTIADDLLAANFGNLDIDDLFKATIFKVDGKFMAEMKATGFPNLGMEELVKARIFKIDAEYVRGLSQIGFTNEPFESVVKMRIFKITPEFITEIRGEGFDKISIEELVKMKIFNINSEFIRQAKSDGVPMEVEKLVQKRIGVWGR